MLIGLEVEAIITRYNKDKDSQQPIRARAVTRRVDGNDSVFEFKGNESPNLHGALESLKNGYLSAIKEIASNRGPLFCQNANVNFIPATIVVVNYEGLDIPLVKACGLHFHMSGFPRKKVSKIRISRKFNKMYKRFGRDAQLRRLPVIGPGSGRIYLYGKGSDLWRNKNGPRVMDWMEFRGAPSSEIVFDETALRDFMEFLAFDGNIKRSRIARIVDACSTRRVDNIYHTIANSGKKRSSVFFYNYKGMDTFMGRPYRVVEINDDGWDLDLFVGVFDKGTSQKKMLITTKADMVNMGSTTFFIEKGQEDKFINDFKNGNLRERDYSVNPYFYLKDSDFNHTTPPMHKLTSNSTLRRIPVYKEIQDVLRGKKGKSTVKGNVVRRLKAEMDEFNKKRERKSSKDREMERDFPGIRREDLGRIKFQ